MQLGMIGLGRMGASMVSRLLQGGHECVVFDMKPDSVKDLASNGATGAASLDDFMAKLKPPRAVWLMAPAAAIEVTVQDLAARMQPGDIVIDGGNSYYTDDIRRARELKPKGIRYVDVDATANRRFDSPQDLCKASQWDHEGLFPN
jgi:6-phosphogluconate dehydrogenase